uniref:low molecular weight protein-tyrosine-phosphatase n=1 Tax=Daejeonella sp. TaxID=2805397 RepID=UPI004049CDBD
MKILMVCLGNICRSPLAHGVLEHLVKEKNLNWEIDSAGTGNWHIGEKPDRSSITVAQKYGVDITNQSCRQFDNSDFEKYDHILVMDQNNLSDVISMATSDADVEKVRLFLKNGIVPDPYHDDNQFEPVYLMIKERCLEIIGEFGSNR